MLQNLVNGLHKRTGDQIDKKRKNQQRHHDGQQERKSTEKIFLQSFFSHRERFFPSLTTVGWITPQEMMNLKASSTRIFRGKISSF